MKILIVEDNEKLARSLRIGLEQEGFAVDCLFDGLIAERRVLVNRDSYDTIVLDLMLPGKDGVAVCRAWRGEGITTPILMLTARDATGDKVSGLNAGADDYLAKPFSFDELVARVRALLRRPQGKPHMLLTAGNITLDPQTRRVHSSGREIALTLKEFMVLEYLMRNKNQVITRDDLYDHAWDFADSSLSNTVDVHVKNIRKKLKDNGKIIQTIRGVGYKMAA
ncbi:response regulator transcription factor [Patescibacteria group bacterium]|jgi:DNA-binding response OmpR family regulator|nr:response regulator transcription factor [Patescibacteria group bacterium]MCL5114629.1 response regulator transcription factor [Patescibacteria group bacterium]